MTLNDTKALVPRTAPSVQTCQPIKDAAAYKSQNWRNEQAYEVIRSIDPSHTFIKIAKFYSYTAVRHDFHLSHNDCTHYCHGPLLKCIHLTCI